MVAPGVQRAVALVWRTTWGNFWVSTGMVAARVAERRESMPIRRAKIVVLVIESAIVATDKGVVIPLSLGRIPQSSKTRFHV